MIDLKTYCTYIKLKPYQGQGQDLCECLMLRRQRDVVSECSVPVLVYLKYLFYDGYDKDGYASQCVPREVEKSQQVKNIFLQKNMGCIIYTVLFTFLWLYFKILLTSLFSQIISLYSVHALHIFTLQGMYYVVIKRKKTNIYTQMTCLPGSCASSPLTPFFSPFP